MPRPRIVLMTCLITWGFTGAALAQAPSPLSPTGGNAFDANIFKAQATSPAAASDPVSTLTGEAPPPRKIWSGNVEAGINGQNGNTDVVNVRTGIAALRKTDDNLFTMNLLYALSKQEGLTTQNQMLFNARDEILFAGSPWSIFGQTNIEYDQFKTYDFLIGVYAGLGYLVLDNGTTFFKLRGGAGAVRQIGGPDERWIPEAVFGYDFNYKFTDRQSFVHSLDYYPRIDKPSQFRLRARAAYEIIVDPATCTALRFGVQDRYDSNPGPNTKKNDVNYFASLVFNF